MHVWSERAHSRTTERGARKHCRDEGRERRAPNWLRTEREKARGRETEYDEGRKESG